LGRWSIGLAAVFILLSILFSVLTALGGVGPDPVALIVIATVIFGISGIAAFITALISIIKSKERSILVFLAAVVGLFCLFFVLGEFLFPH
jgi:tellurite resistance protein TehA-like permease